MIASCMAGALDFPGGACFTLPCLSCVQRGSAPAPAPKTYRISPPFNHALSDSQTWKGLRSPGVSHLALRFPAEPYSCPVPVGPGCGSYKRINKTTKKFLGGSHARTRLRTTDLSPTKATSTLRMGTWSVSFLSGEELGTQGRLFFE